MLKIIVLSFFTIFLLCANSYAEEPGSQAYVEADGDGIIEPGEDIQEELAKAAQNPLASMISLPFQNNTDFGLSPGDKTKNTFNIQPVWPFRVGESWNLITRTILPIVSQPGMAPGQDRTDGLGDTTFTSWLSPSESGAWTWGVGPVALIPTASDDVLGADKWGLGGSVVVLTMPGKWVIGSLFSNVWSVGGSGDHDVNLFTWQYFINYNLDDGWYLVTSPIMTANWEADSGEKWTIPVGGGIGKIVKFGQLPVNINAQAYHMAESPKNGPDWQARFQVQFMFPKGM